MSAVCFDDAVAPQPSLRKTFGQACVDARLGLDLTQQQIAVRVGVSRSYIAKVELGLLDPTLDMVERIAGALGLDVQLIIRYPIFPAGVRVQGAVHANAPPTQTGGFAARDG